MTRYILAVDVGTTAVKTILFNNEKGEIKASVVIEYPISYFGGGWAEQDPEMWWSAVVSSIREVIRRGGISPSEIEVVGLSGQMEGCITVGRDGKPLRPAILHIDTRARSEVNELTKKLGINTVYEITRNILDAESTLAKILWIKNNEPHVFSSAKKFLSGAKDYIAYRLTSNFVTDYVDASISYLLDMRKRNWSEELCNAIGISVDQLPVIKPAASIAGEICDPAAKETGLIKGTPVAVGSGDLGCSTVGAGVVKVGEACSYIGSTAWIASTSNNLVDGRYFGLYNFIHPDPSMFNVVGAVLCAGHSLRWFRDELGRLESCLSGFLEKDPYELLDEEALKSPVGAKGLIFLPYLAGERTPIRDHDVRGVFFGLSLQHRKNDLIRAVLEGVAYALKDVEESMNKVGAGFHELRIFGGGAKSRLWARIITDAIGKRIIILENGEYVTCIGAAAIAGIASKTYRGYHDVKKLVGVKEEYEPDENHVRIYSEYYKIYKKIYENTKQCFKELYRLRELSLDKSC